MASRSRLITIGIVTFVIGIILFFPARVAYRWFAPPEVALGGITGSVWNGGAREAVVSELYLHDLTWSFRPLSFARAKLGYDVESKFSSGFIEGNIAIGITGVVIARDLIGSIPLSMLQDVVGVPGLQGNLRLEFRKLEVAAGVPVVADGELEVSQLLIPIVDNNSLGGFKAEFFTQAAGIAASVEDTNAVFDLAGSLEIFPDGSFQFLAPVKPTAETPGNVRQQLEFLGYELRSEGIL